MRRMRNKVGSCEEYAEKAIVTWQLMFETLRKQSKVRVAFIGYDTLLLFNAFYCNSWHIIS